VVAADDENELTIYDDAGGRLLERLRLFPGELPDEPKARKKAKPDIEALAMLPGERLLALGSGSASNRNRGAIWPLCVAPISPVVELDLSPLYATLIGELPELNIEGAAVSGDVLRLFQRGNGPSRVNAVIDLDLAGALAAIERDRALGGGLVRAIHSVDLGTFDGVALAFTDGSPLADGRILFSAAAEDSPDTYRDGPTMGSSLGMLDATGQVEWIEPLEGTAKVEGVQAGAASAGGVINVLMVADDDDPSACAPLLAAEIDARATRG